MSNNVVELRADHLIEDNTSKKTKETITECVEEIINKVHGQYMTMPREQYELSYQEINEIIEKNLKNL